MWRGWPGAWGHGGWPDIRAFLESGSIGDGLEMGWAGNLDSGATGIHWGGPRARICSKIGCSLHSPSSCWRVPLSVLHCAALEER